MKLYTEEQIKEAMETALIPPIYRQDLWGHLTPIELPSDEDLDEWIAKNDYIFSPVSIQDAKWVIEKIKQQVIP